MKQVFETKAKDGIFLWMVICDLIENREKISTVKCTGTNPKEPMLFTYGVESLESDVVAIKGFPYVIEKSEGGTKLKITWEDKIFK